VKAAPPRCRICEKRPATASVEPDTWERSQGTRPTGPTWTVAMRTHWHFCDQCRKVAAFCSDDEKVVLFHAACLQIDAVQVLMDAMVKERRRLKRAGLAHPGITLRSQSARRAAYLVRRPGETANAFRQRRHRALKPKA
jgi:hypothetical protein